MIWLNVPAASTGSSTPPPTNLQLQLTFWTQHRLSLCTLLPRVPTVPLCVYHIHIANEDERGESIAPREWRGSFPQDLSSFRIISDAWTSVCECQCEAASYHWSCSSWKDASQVIIGLFQLIGVHPHGGVNVALPLKKAKLVDIIPREPIINHTGTPKIH